MSSHNDKLSRLFSLSESDRLLKMPYLLYPFALLLSAIKSSNQAVITIFQSKIQNPLAQRRVQEASSKALVQSKMVLPIFLVLLGGGLVSCSNVAQIGNSAINIGDRAGNVTKIGDLKPKQNASTQVYLQGKVIDQAPFLKAGAYQIQDATGKIWIVTNQTLPNVGDTIVIKGKLEFKSIPLGGQELGEVYVEEQKKF